MFYWDKKDNGFDLKNRFKTMESVKEVFVATAYLSIEGVAILQDFIEHYGVKRNNVTVCLSSEFSENDPSDILIRLNTIANVRIAKDIRLFHPKVYYIKGKPNSLVIFGSSNLTMGGFDKNIEFDQISEPTENDISQLEDFKKFCFAQTALLSDEHIEYYKNQESQLNELKKVKALIADRLRSFEKRNDPFTENTYDLTDFYFDFADYETFFKRNSALHTSYIMERRSVVKNKLIKIHNSIEKQVRELNLSHWDSRNIISLDRPSSFNNYTVDWMGIRYGKRENEIRLGGGIKEPYESFTKHACLQCNVYPRGFDVVLFFAVPKDAWDRQQLDGRFRNDYDSIAQRINQKVRDLRGHGLVWEISGCKSFDIDTEDDLAAYLKNNDRDGRFSSLNMYFAPNDTRIKTLPDICNEVLKGFKLFKPLYDVLAWRSNKL